MPARLLAVLVISSVATTLSAQDSGWKADPERVEQLSKQRSEFNYHESKVPDFELPDPLLMSDGSRVESSEQWPARRQEILELFREHVYGRRPAPPETLNFEVTERDENALDGKATLERVSIQSTQDGRKHSFELLLFFPNEKKEPVPVFLLINNRAFTNTDPTRNEKAEFWPVEEAIARGYGIAAIQNADLAPDDKAKYRDGIMTLFEGTTEGEREGDAFGALAAWGWGASRALDYFETNPRVDAKKVAVLGHSRGGKCALWAGAEDERFALVISNESGCGGAALSRRRYGETVKRINDSFPHWFCDNFTKYNANEDALPVDQHMLIALMAPRAVYVGSADQDLWADPRGEFLSVAHSSPVFALWDDKEIGPNDMPSLGQPLTTNHRGYHVRKGPHNLTLEDWNHYMDFADKLWGSK